MLGRPIAADEFPHAIPQLLMQARERSPMGEERPLSNGFRNWLGRTLQLDVRRAFASAPEALAALEETLASDSSYVAGAGGARNVPRAVHRRADRCRRSGHDADAVDRAAVGAGRVAQLHAAGRQRRGRPRRRARPGRAGGRACLRRKAEATSPSNRRRAPSRRRAQPVPTLAELIAVDDLRAAADAAGAVDGRTRRAVQGRPFPVSVPASCRSLALDNSLAKMRESSEPVAVDLEVEEPAHADARACRRSVAPGGHAARLIAVAVVLAAVLGGGAYASRFVGPQRAHRLRARSSCSRVPPAWKSSSTA